MTSEIAYHSVADAAAAASAQLGMRIRGRDIQYLVGLGITPSTQSGDRVAIRAVDLELTAARVHPQADVDGLLGSLDILSTDVADSESVPSDRFDTPTLIVFAPGLAVSFSPDHCRPEDVQRLIALWRLRGTYNQGTTPAGPLQYAPLGHSLELVSTAARTITESVLSMWMTAGGTGRDPSYAEAVSAPSLYGNKGRLAAFIAGVVGLYLPEGSQVIDVMSGTGVVARALAERFVAYAADANPYAVVLSSGQGVHITDAACDRLLSQLNEPFFKNHSALNDACRDIVEHEDKFLHAHIDDSSLESYRHFTTTVGPFVATPRQAGEQHVLARMVSDRLTDSRGFPFCLVTAYFANAYFGIQQAIEIDSLRYAIDNAGLNDCERQFALAILMATAVSCASGPHFAQPPKVTSPAAMGEIIEHRARSVRREFETLARVACKRPVLRHPIQVLKGDWRSTIELFDSGVRDWSSGVYIDPPYSKLQYSRYYHVLNTLVAYDYPACIGQGRYPDRNSRFSSRFEYRPNSAAKEFQAVFETCAERRLHTFVSYSDRGFVPLADLQRLMSSAYPSVHLYSKRVKHHSQGVKLRSRTTVTEYVLVGGPRRASAGR